MWGVFDISNNDKSYIKSWNELKDKYTHNTCQIYVKPHSKNTQITLESQIFDEKALR